MNRIAQKNSNHARRQHRVRANLTGSSDRPRLSVHISNQHVSAQIIDDTTHKTLAYATTIGKKQAAAQTMTQKAEQVGTDIAKKAKSQKLKTVVFDRGGKLYHGRIKALADAARKEGLEF